MIRKATEDFQGRTLGVLPTLLEKLAYICSLQLTNGGYRHWGLTRTYGERPAQEAIRAAHAAAAMDLIQVPIREIYEEYQHAVERQEGPEGLKPESFVLKAPVSDDGLLSAHLRLLEKSVKALARQERTTPQVA